MHILDANTSLSNILLKTLAQKKSFINGFNSKNHKSTIASVFPTFNIP
jgi:hypothetical protein